MKKLFVFYFMIFFQICFGGILDHLKKAENKDGPYQMRNIDFIYMINLDRRPEKFQQTLDQLAPYGIIPYRFSAVNGWELSFETVNDVGVKYQKGMKKGIMGTTYLPEFNWEPLHEIISKIGRTYFCHCTAKGTIGCYLSHLSVLKDAYDSNYETIWVMEDDIDVIQDPHLISDLIDKLDELVGKSNWDILFTDRDIKNLNGNYVICRSAAKRPDFTPSNPKKFAIKKKISSDLRLIGARYGTHSMIIRRSGMKKILDFAKKYQMFLPIDMDYTLPEGIKLYTVLNNIVSNFVGAISDNGVERYIEND